jgi:hypothetical protein
VGWVGRWRKCKRGSHLGLADICSLPVPSKNGVLIKYLLDELTHAEQDHSDALSLTPNGFDQSRAGEASLLAPVTTEEFRSRFVELTHSLTTVTSAVTMIRDELAACERRMEVRLEKTATELMADGFKQYPQAPGNIKSLHAAGMKACALFSIHLPDSGCNVSTCNPHCPLASCQH